MTLDSSQISRLRAELAVAPAVKPPRRPQPAVTGIIALAETGATQVAIARQLGVTQGWVSRVLTRHREGRGGKA